MADHPDDIRIPFTLTVPVPRTARSGRWPDTGILHPGPHGYLLGTHPVHTPLVRQEAGRQRSHRHGQRARMQIALELTAIVVAESAPLVTGAEIAAVIAGGVETAVAFVLLPEFLAGLAAVGTVVIIYAGVRYAFANPEFARWWARQMLDGLTPDEHLPIADQIPPLPPIEAGPNLPPNGGVHPTVRLPPLPPSEPVPPRPAVNPGAEIVPQAPIIVENRNHGLSGPARTRTRAGRDAARRADPEVTRVLGEAEWEAHHLINLGAIRANDPVIAAALRAGWRTDGVLNLAALPSTEAARQRLLAAGVRRPLHDSGHPGWNERVRQGLRKIEQDLQDRGIAGGIAGDQAARRELEDLQRTLRLEMLQEGRLSRLEDGGQVQDA